MKWKDVLTYAKQGVPAPEKRVEKTEAEWKALLTPEQFRVTRQAGTERAFTGEHCESHAEGTYACVCCKTPLFTSEIKFESHSGWPSFTKPIKENAIKYHEDFSFGMHRVETVCNTCDAHLGHVFPDGPPPTGLRFCINSAALDLVGK